MSPNWSNEELSNLRELWLSKKKISENLNLFDGKTINAIGSKARRAKLGRRGKPRQEGDTWFHIKTIIAFHGPITSWQVAKRLDITVCTVRRHIHEHRGELNIYEWPPGESGVKSVPAYRLGPGRDAPRPIKSNSKVKKEMRFRRSLAKGKANIFGTLIKQIV